MRSNIHKLVQSLRDQQKTLVLAESMTCGLAAHQFAKVKGTSEVFLGGIVCYNADVKVKLLKVNKKLIDTYTAESQEVTDELVRKLPALLEADIYGAVTGLATTGGSETEEKPVGTVFFSVRYGERIISKRVLYKGKPNQIVKQAYEGLFQFIYNQLNSPDTK